MRKILSLVLSIAMVMSCFGMTAFAADEANTVGVETYANGSFADACYTPDTAVWTKATAEIQAANANGTYVGDGKYYTTGSLNGSGENVTSVLMTNVSKDDPTTEENEDDTKCVFAMNNATTFNNLTDLTDADRIHYSGYFNVIQGTVSSANILPANAGGIDISQNLLYQKSNFGVNNGRWVRFDVFYQPTITYTYTKTDAEGNKTTGTWKSNKLQNSTTKETTGGVDWTLMPDYDSTCTYTATKSTHGLTSSYINGEPVIVDMPSDSGFTGTRDWDNLASRIAFHGSGAVVAFAEGKMELIRKFDASTYEFVDYPELTSGEKYTISGNNLIYNQPITAADIAAPAGFTVAAYSDTACTKPVTGAISLGDTIAVSNGPIISYYEASDGRADFFADRDGNNASLGWDVDGTTLRIYDIPGVGTGGMPSFEGDNGANLAPWANVSGITDIVIEDGITHIGKWTIAGKKVNSVTIPSSVSAFDGYAFNGSTITTLIFEEGCTGFGDAVINRDSSVNNIYLPSTANPSPGFYRGLNTASTDKPYVASNKAITIYANEDTAAYTWATTVQENKPADVTITINTDYSDRLYTFVRKSYLSGITVSNGKGALGAGASGDSNDTSIECYSTDAKEDNAFIGGPNIDTTLFAKRNYAVFEADVKFTENSKYFFYGSNQHKQISPNVYSDNVLLLDGWNRVMTVVERATGNAKTYINGLLYVEAPGAVLGENTNTATRFIFYNNDNGISEKVPVGYVDNMAIYATDVNPAATFTAPLTATAYNSAAGVTFTVSDDVKALASNVVIAAAYDAVGNMLGNVVIASDSVTITPVAGATKYVGYVWNSLEGLAPITASLAVNVPQ